MTNRKTIISDTTISRVVENTATIKENMKLNDKEQTIYSFVCDLFTSGKLQNGFQFGINKMNNRFVEWENGKATVKSKVFPCVREWENACKFYYLKNGSENGFFPIVITNNDNATIIQVIPYDNNFYKVYLPKEKAKKEEKEFDLIETIENLSLLSSVSNEEVKILNNAIRQIQELRKKNSSILHKVA